MAIIVFACFKGGVGKSTLTMNTAAVLTDRGYRVLVMDADPQQTASEWANSAPPGNPFPAVIVRNAREGRLGDDLRAFAKDYDFVLVDTAPREDNNPALAAAMAVADIVLVPLAPSPADIRPARRTAIAIKEAQLNYN